MGLSKNIHSTSNLKKYLNDYEKRHVAAIKEGQTLSIRKPPKSPNKKKVPFKVDHSSKNILLWGSQKSHKSANNSTANKRTQKKIKIDPFLLSMSTKMKTNDDRTALLSKKGGKKKKKKKKKGFKKKSHTPSLGYLTRSKDSTPNHKGSLAMTPDIKKQKKSLDLNVFNVQNKNEKSPPRDSQIKNTEQEQSSKNPFFSFYSTLSKFIPGLSVDSNGQ